MKKMLKQNKGFSLVELLVAILIMAVIAATAITLFSGVLNSSRKGADEETAESIKRAILTYISMTNDTDLSCLNVTQSDDLIAKLSCIINISDEEVTFSPPSNVTMDTIDDVTTGIDASDIKGEFGPFLDASKDMTPKTPGTNGWKIDIDEKTQVVIVNTEKESEQCIVTLEPVTP